MRSEQLGTAASGIFLVRNGFQEMPVTRIHFRDAWISQMARTEYPAAQTLQSNPDYRENRLVRRGIQPH